MNEQETERWYLLPKGRNKIRVWTKCIVFSRLAQKKMNFQFRAERSKANEGKLDFFLAKEQILENA